MDATQRITVTLPKDIKERMDAVADSQNTSFAALLRRFAQLGLLAYDLAEKGGENGIVVRQDGRDRLVTFF